MTNPDPTKIYLSPVEKDNIKHNSATRQLIEVASATATSVTSLSSSVTSLSSSVTTLSSQVTSLSAVVSGLRTHLAGAKTFYVATAGSTPAGNDSSGDGSSGAPWLTLTNAVYQIFGNYDLGTQNPILQLVGSPWNEGFFVNNAVVGSNLGPSLTIQGDPTTPSNIVLDGTALGDNAFFLQQGQSGWIHIDGIQFQNWSAFPISNNAVGATVSLGNLNFSNCSAACIGVEGPGTIISGSAFNNSGGNVPNTLKFSGTLDQIVYAAFGGTFDPNDAVMDCTANPSFGTALFNLEAAGVIRYYSNVTGSPTGRAFQIRNGGVLKANTVGGGSYINWYDMPGDVLGINYGGYFNDGDTPIMTYSELPTTPNNGYRAEITDGSTTQCADGTCTTFGTHVTGGGGSHNLLVWWNGSNWTLIGK